MKYIEYTFPELDQVQSMNTDEQQVLVDEIRVLHYYQEQVVQTLLEKKVFALYEKFQPNIEKVIIDPRYINDEKNEESYFSQNAMVWVDEWVDPCKENNEACKFQRALDLALENMVPLMKHVVEIDVEGLINKYGIKEEKEDKPQKTRSYQL